MHGTTGLDPKIATELGISAEPGTFGYEDIAAEDFRMYKGKEITPVGFYGGRQEESVWSPQTVQLYRAIAEAKDERQREELRAKLNTHMVESVAPGQIYGGYDLPPPTRWTATTPLTIVIAGLGPAGLEFAANLLEHFPFQGRDIKLIIYEANPANLGGYGYDGVAPDSPSTKGVVAAKLKAILSDKKRVKYVGATKVALKHNPQEPDQPSFEQLQKDYPGRVFDGTGAVGDRKLDIEDPENFLIPWKDISDDYNGAHASRLTAIQQRILSHVGDELLIIGGGNVSADIARIFAKDTPKLVVHGRINPAFIQFLKKAGIKKVTVVARNPDPLGLKVDLAELRAFADSGVSLLATFEDNSDAKLEAVDEERLTILRKAQARRKALADQPIRTVEEVEPQVHFVLGFTPKKVTKVEGSTKGRTEVVFSGANGQVFKIQPKAAIVAAGFAEPVPNPHAQQIGLSAGLSQGGNLGIIKKNVGEAFNAFFTTATREGAFDVIPPQPEQPRAPITAFDNDDQLAILAFNQEKRRGRRWTPEMITEARHYRSDATPAPESKKDKKDPPQLESAGTAPKSAPKQDTPMAQDQTETSAAKGEVIVVQGTQRVRVKISEYAGQTLFSAHTKAAEKEGQDTIPGKCKAGQVRQDVEPGTCGGCMVVVSDSTQTLLPKPKKQETELLDGQRFINAELSQHEDRLRISCMHEVDKFAGQTVTVPGVK